MLTRSLVLRLKIKGKSSDAVREGSCWAEAKLVSKMSMYRITDLHLDTHTHIHARDS